MKRLLIHGFRQRGFSMVELAMTLVVLGILLALAFPSFRPLVANSQLRTTTESLRSGLQLARAEAVRRNARTIFNLNGTLWTITLADNTQVETNEGENLGGAEITATQPQITFNGIGWVWPAAAITFDITNPAGGACAKDNGEMRCMRVLVSAAGQIRMCDPAAPEGQQAACPKE